MLYELPEHEEYLKQLLARWKENELGIHLIKSLDERVLKNVIAQEAIRNHLVGNMEDGVIGIDVNI